VTWTKLSDDYSDDCRELSDAAFRTHTEALIWIMRRETGGYIDANEIRRFAESPHASVAVDELVATGWWSIERQGYRVHHHMEHQPEPDLIARRRAATADRVKRHRRKKADLPLDPADPNASFPSRPDPSRPVPGNAFGNASSNGVTTWPEVAQPGSGAPR